MIFSLASLSSRRTLQRAFAFSLCCSTLGAGVALAQTAPTVFVNPRTGADDPRVGLKGGLYDAGVASSGLELVVTTPKPGSFAPDLEAIAAANAAPVPPPPAPGAPRGTGPRGPSYGGTNSDLAFSGKYLFSGNYLGINFYDISDPAKIKLVTSVVCPGGQGDVSVYGHLLFMSVEAANGRLDCGTQGLPVAPGQTPPSADVLANVPPTVPGAAATPPARAQRPPDPASPDRIKGVRIFDISDITKPKQIVDVQTCRGSHTHTLLVDPKDKDNVYLYVSGSAPVRAGEELNGCTGKEDDPNTALFTIVVIKVPIAHPELAKVVNSPRIFSDPQTGEINALWKGGNHGEGTQTTSATRGCHDITVFSSLGLAAGACSGNGILLDISDPVHPKRLDAVTDPNYAFWHSANFANDGKTLLFTDEWGGGGQARCRDSDPMNWGADAIFKLDKGKLTLASYYKMPAPQSEFENCVAHNGSLVPVPGRNILVQSWYQGGVSVMDFTDATHPYEIAFFDRGPIGVGGRRAGGGQWSSYYYNGYIFGSEMARGIDVLKLLPSKYLTQNELDAAAQVHLAELNVQNQPKIVWPQNFITARAYIDQLARSNALTPEKVTALNAAIDKKKTKELKVIATSLDKDASTAATPADADRMHALAEIIKQK
ncbi:MAG: putative secreted protein [Acidobacteriaceae bacterium]|nr:putative secreted protein [Acidobacteriaceae bacterium]